MRIASIETFTRDKISIVRVRTDDGAEGIGQTSPFRVDITARLLHTMVAPFFLGRDPWELEMLVEACLRHQYKYPGTFLLRAMCGVDTALWDLLGRTTGQPVYQLLGGKIRDPVPMYASSMQRSVTPEQEAERMQALVEEYGFRCGKIRLGVAMGRDGDEWTGRTRKLIPYMREAMGDDFDLSADANGAYSPAQAIRVGRLLEDADYFHYEEPCPFEELENTAAVAAALDIPVAGGEQDNSLPQFRRMLTMRAVDVVQLDVGYIGGISRARRVAQLAELFGVPCTPHCSNHSMLQVFTLHLAAAMPACSQYQEWGIESAPWTRGIYEPMPRVEDGQITVPATPGWGVTVLPEFLDAAYRQESREGDVTIPDPFPWL